MRIFACLFFILFMAAPLPAAESRFYLGTYTDQSGSKGIYEGSLDPATGKLGSITLAAPATSPSFLALSPKGDGLYAALEQWNKAGVGAFRRTPDGKLAPLNSVSAGGMDSCHVSVDPGGRKVFIANYNSGSIDCFRIVVGGEVSQATQEIPFVGSGPNAERQQAPHAHSVSVGPDGTRLYACDLGSDKVWIYKITDAGLIPNDPAFAQVPPGSGPRHIVFSRDGHFAYVASELGHCVTAFARNAADGGLTPLQTISVIPPELAGEKAATAELALHPSGKWLYESNRFCNTLSVLQVGADGKVSLIQSVPALVKGPRSFAIDPGGRWLIAAGQEDNRIAELKIDPATGLLRATTEAAQVGSPACVLFEGN